MGWYLKKSFAFGPLRLNLSRSGLGASVGAKGLRASIGPRGKQIHAGREGLYYRASLNSRKRPHIEGPKVTETGGKMFENDVAFKPSTAGRAVASSVGRQLGNQLLRGILGGFMRGR